MNYSLVCLIGCLSLIPFGLAFLLVPESISSLYGVAGWNPGTTAIARLFGIMMLYIGCAAFAIKDTKDRVVQQRVSLTFAVVSAVAILVSGSSILSGATNSFMWSTVAIHVFFTVAWASIVFRKN